MSSRLFKPPLLNPEFYDSWKREIQLWKVDTNISPSRQAPAGFLSLTDQARTAILEIDISLLNAEDGIDKLVEKLDTLFLEDKNQSAFICLIVGTKIPWLYWHSPEKRHLRPEAINQTLMKHVKALKYSHLRPRELLMSATRHECSASMARMSGSLDQLSQPQYLDIRTDTHTNQHSWLKCD